MTVLRPLNSDTKSIELKKDILRLCIRENSYSISDLSNALGASVPTITKIIGEMMADGYLQDEGKIDTKGGRRPNTYGLNAKAGYFVGVDIARQHFHIEVCDFKGQEIDFIQDIEFVLEANADSFRSICRRVKEEVTSRGIKWEKVLAAGISLTGRVNPEKGFSLSYFVSEELPLKDIFEQQLGVPVIIENDSRAMAYGEFMHLGKKADKDMIFVNLSWGLGMGMILGGKLHYGKSGYSGEIGHFPSLNNDIICRCGKVGCLETGASGSALHRIIIEKLEKGRQSSLSASWKANGEIDLQEILDAVKEEDVLAIEGIEKVGTILGRGIAGVINVFNPGLVVIGGRLIVGKEYLMLPIKTSVNRFSLSKVSSDTRFVFSELDRKAAGFGDCLLARNNFLGI